MCTVKCIVLCSCAGILMSAKKQTAMHCVRIAISKTIMTTKTAVDTGEEFFVGTNNYIVSIQHKINVHLNKEIN